MSDDLVRHICQMWVADGLSEECFWEGWPECPTPEDILTPRMVLNCIEELEAKLAKAVEFTKGVIRHAGNSGDDYLAEQARATLAEMTGDTP